MEDKSRKPTDTEEVEEDEPEAALELDDEDASMPDAEPAEIEINSGAPTAAAGGTGPMGWSATDDVLLKDSLQTLGTLEAVARQVRFSVRVTPEQLEERWRRILFDENVAREAAVQMSSAAAQGLAKRVMWSAREEEVLRGIGPTGYTAFLALLEQPGQREIFHSSRTPKSLEAHYYRMKRYGSLQAAGEAAGDERERREMSDAEEEIAVEIRAGPPPPAPSEERARDLRALERRQGAEVLALERELELAGLGPGEGNALAVLRGRRMRVALRTKEALLGRTTRESRPDVNLLEEELPPGAQARISRRAALLRLKRDLRFHLTNLSRRPLFVNGRPLAPTRRRILPDQALIEVEGIRLIFEANKALLNRLRRQLRRERESQQQQQQVAQSQQAQVQQSGNQESQA